MSSSFGSVCLLVFMGAVLTFGSPVHPKDLKDVHKYIEGVLGLNSPEISTHPLFNSVINSINTSCQRKEEVQLMNVTLNIYLRIFSSILDHSSSTLLDNVPDRREMEHSIERLKETVEDMKRRLNRESQQNHNKEEVLRKLHRIQVDDPEVQKKALAQFREIHKAASVIGEKCGSAHSPSAQ